MSDSFNAQRVIQAAIPNASDATIEHILWGRTCYPVGPITPKSVYKAASQWKRACDNDIMLCDWCDQKAEGGKWMCSKCSEVLLKHVSTPSHA